MNKSQRKVLRQIETIETNVFVCVCVHIVAYIRKTLFYLHKIAFLLLDSFRLRFIIPIVLGFTDA